MTMIKIILSFTALLLLFASLLHASDTATLKCDFDKFSSEDKSNQKEKLSLTFIYDLKTDKTYLVGNNGSSEVKSIPNNAEHAMTFVEISGVGNVMITTVNQKSNKAVHSRHTIFNGKLMPSQYYGSCKAL